MDRERNQPEARLAPPPSRRRDAVVRIPNRPAWWLIRASMEIAVLRLVWRGMPWPEARRRVAEEAKLYMHRNITPQFDRPPERP